MENHGDGGSNFDIPGIQQRAGDFVASSMDAIITFNEQWKIVLFNPAAERVFGYRASEVLGSSVDMLLAERFRQIQCSHAKSFADSGATSQPMGPEDQLWGLRTNGEEFPFEATITRTQVEGAILFGILLRDITERVNARRALEQSEAFNRNLVLHCPVAMVVTSLPEQKCEMLNRRFTELFGYTREDVPDVGHWWALAYPDEGYRQTMKERWEARLKRAIERSESFEPFEALVRCKDGSQKYIEFSVSFVGNRSVVTFVDLTDRYLAELERRRGEEKYREVAEVAPVMIWMTDPHAMSTYLSKSWVDFTGVPLERQLGDGWAETIHPADRERCLEVFKAAAAKRELYHQEMRFRRHDGEYRWIYDTGVPRYSSDGEFAGYIGSCLDITDRKTMEEALSTFGRRLLQAQEEERLRIARELHDDFGQRLAVISMELQGAGKVLDHVRELAFDLQSLSHRLHSSSLEHFGLVVATRRLCKEMGERLGIDIEFHSENIPRNVAYDIRLCLFRVSQEALKNILKHSNARNVELSLVGTDTEIQLTIQDSGIGFDITNVDKAAGLGIISMRERLKLVNGGLSIQSVIDRGTTLRATVPVVLEQVWRMPEMPTAPANV
ncbi:sensor histidine kinase [Occallatibacter riparius]|uniref:PAS domain S-box protein n=1 Tax=Occallatibacter riparius TaxID=1002689 RepID=A0A9J7BP70_9BACT|nr:PAS domain S-box protein [Occallatibacter riparius]UWZ83546.1 PAS domain S-box protein [Occallatibacter riparius]